MLVRFNDCTLIIISGAAPVHTPKDHEKAKS